MHLAVNLRKRIQNQMVGSNFQLKMVAAHEAGGSEGDGVVFGMAAGCRFKLAESDGQLFRRVLDPNRQILA
jgi:hypothetical protein